MKYRELYEYGCLQLQAASIAESRIDARLLLEYVCHTTANDLLVNGDCEVTSSDENSYVNLVKQRARHIPLQHLTQTQNFMGLEFYVNQYALIPRQDTEILVEEVLKNLHDGMRILDMCTGSGCILLSLLHYSNDCTGCGVDISKKALEVAKHNCRQLQLSAEFIESDLFNHVEGYYDIIVSNPPYIRTCEIEELMPEVRDYEPFNALNGHEDGLFFYQRIAKEAMNHMKIGSMLAFEIGYDQAKAVIHLMEDYGYCNINAFKDFAGNDRVVTGYFGGTK